MKISVITVCYNSIATLQDTLESILRQTYPDMESIVVDGASKDGTVELIEKYSHQFSGRMKWLSEPDKGIYDAMNKGISMATGDIIGFLNADDYYQDGMGRMPYMAICTTSTGQGKSYAHGAERSIVPAPSSAAGARRTPHSIVKGTALPVTAALTPLSAARRILSSCCAL